MLSVAESSIESRIRSGCGFLVSGNIPAIGEAGTEKNLIFGDCVPDVDDVTLHRT